MTMDALYRGKQVGRSVPRIEGRAKVTGRAEYIHNLRLPGMLTGKIFRSTVAHGRIKRIDVSADALDPPMRDRKSTRLNSSHQIISYAVFCLKKKKLSL